MPIDLTKKTVAFITCLVCCAPQLRAQVSEGGRPLSLDAASAAYLLPIRDVPQTVLPAADITRLQQEDAAGKQSPLRPFRIGRVIPADVSFPTSGLMTTLPNGSHVWRTQVQVSGAKALGLYFDRMHLPAGVRLYEYNSAATQILGAYTAAENPADGQWATEKVQGEIITLELDMDAGVAPEDVSLHIDNVCQFYRSIGYLEAYNPAAALSKTTTYFAYGSSSPCEINAICPAGTSFAAQRKATVHIEYISGQDAYAGSGTMMNNTANDCKPYVLTASHVEPTNSQLASTYTRWIFYFNYETPICNYTGTQPAGNTLTGATFKARSSYNSASNSINGDFLLVELKARVPASYGAYFSGWDRTGTTPTGTDISFHHPSGDVKKLSIANAALPNGNFNGGGTNTHWYCLWTQGGTEEGSSGSGLFISNGRLIGDLSGGSTSNNPACADTNSSGETMSVNGLYSKISLNWLYAAQTPSSATSRLKDWLDSAGTGATVLDAISANCSTGNTAVNTVSNASGISVYPNPSSGIVQVQAGSAVSGELTISIYNMVGGLQMARTVAGSANTWSFDLSSYPEGIYLVQITGYRFRQTAKVTIRH